MSHGLGARFAAHLLQISGLRADIQVTKAEHAWSVHERWSVAEEQALDRRQRPRKLEDTGPCLAKCGEAEPHQSCDHHAQNRPVSCKLRTHASAIDNRTFSLHSRCQGRRRNWADTECQRQLLAEVDAVVAWQLRRSLRRSSQNKTMVTASRTRRRRS